eukprot:GHVQ01020010.1.p1 GENE.GHVQ01020010.1~~GHVQ01020010.1.p1  ORF type:complete len:605 (-),score=79.82 GHVQ01020010.1:181-1995(-)
MTDVLDFLRSEIQTTANTSASRIDAIRRTPLVASALGPAKSRQLLLPMLREVHSSGDDELIHGLCSEYARLFSYIGGAEYVQLLLDPLEDLLQQEETVVRDKAVSCVCELMDASCAESATPVKLVHHLFLPLVQRLSTKDKWFTARVSACGIIPRLYPLCSTQQAEEVRCLFAQLCPDDTPMVKRAAAQQTQELYRVVDKADVVDSLFPSFQALWQRDADCIRVHLLGGLLELSRKMDSEENNQIVIPLLLASAEDKSWRVRLQLAKLFEQFAVAVGSSINALMRPYQNLLLDTEHDVRKHSIRAIAKIAELLPVEGVCASIVPAMELLSKDPVSPVRSELASVLVGVCVRLGSRLAEQHLMLILTEFLRDEQFDVKLNILKHAGCLCDKVDPLCYVILNSVKPLMDDAQWRIRLVVVKLIPPLSEALGIRTFESRLQPAFFQALLDNVHAVRETAIDCIESLAKSFGEEWTVNALTPKVLEIYTKSMICNLSKNKAACGMNEKPKSYMTRISILRTLPKLASVMTPKDVENLLLPVLSHAFRDEVPNVRFSGANIAAWLVAHKHLDAAVVQREISSVLVQLLEEDKDIDVRYFCNEAIVECQH